MIKKHLLAAFLFTSLFIINSNAQPSSQHNGMCSNPQVQSELVSYLKYLWVGCAEMYETNKPNPDSAARALPAERIEKIKAGTYSKIVGIYATTTDDKLPTDCMAIIKSTITSTDKTIDTPAYPMYYDVYSKKDGSIDIHIHKNSPDYELLSSVARSFTLYFH